MTATRRRLLLRLLVGLLVVTAGCAGSSQSTGGDAGGADGENLEAQSAQRDAGSGDGGGGGGDAAAGESDDAAVQAKQRAVIQTGQVGLVVDDYGTAEQNISRAVERQGGFVSDSSVQVNRVDNKTYRTGTLVLRVPQENFSATMEHVKAVGEVQSANTDSEDVTDQLVDINARLKNLRAERERLRELYRNASDTEDVLAVEERLSEVQEEIERLEARKKSLKRQVALSTIRVELREPRPDPIAGDPWYQTPLVVAFLESIDGALTTLRALGVLTAYVLPYLLVFGTPVVLVLGGVVALFRRRGRRSSPPADPGDTGADARGDHDDGSVETGDDSNDESRGEQAEDDEDAAE
jgi:hypothetical protein